MTSLAVPMPKAKRAKAPSRYLLITPSLVFLALTFGLSLFIFLRNSLLRNGGFGTITSEFTLDNYLKIIDGYYLEILLNTVWVSALVVAFSALLGYPMALWMMRRRSVWASALMLLVLSSNAMSLVVRALGWIGIMADNGPINAVLLGAGVIADPLPLLGGNSSVIIGLLHGFVPLFVLTLLPVLQAIDPNLEQAAAGLGAGAWTTLWKVTLPLSAPGIVAGSVLTFAMCMGAYTTPALLSGGRATTFPMLIQQQIAAVMNFPFAAALSAVLLFLVLFMTWSAAALAGRYFRVS